MIRNIYLKEDPAIVLGWGATWRAFNVGFSIGMYGASLDLGFVWVTLSW